MTRCQRKRQYRGVRGPQFFRLVGENEFHLFHTRFPYGGKYTPHSNANLEPIHSCTF